VRREQLQIKHWLEPPFFPDDEKRTSQARIMNTVGLYFVLALTISGFVFVPLFAKHKPESWLVILALYILYGIARFFLYRGQLAAASAFMIISGWILCEGLAFIGGGISSPMMFSVAAITIAIGLLFQARIGNLFLGISILAGLGFALLQQSGYILPRFFNYSPIAIWFLFTLALIFMNRVMNLAMRDLENALALAQQEIARRKTLEAQLRHQSIHDGLTGVYNRVFFEEELARLEHGRKFPVSIIIADVDNLKAVNDTQGHAVGDELLRHVTTTLRVIFRADDMLARVGGDEFVILLPQTDPITADRMLLRVHAQLNEHNIRYPDLPIQISLGVATAEQGKLMDAFVVADQRMYADKAMRKSEIKAPVFADEKRSAADWMM
jgi:diguanylate cyclase (GGDEF)-like protein